MSHWKWKQNNHLALVAKFKRFKVRVIERTRSRPTSVSFNVNVSVFVERL